MKGTDKLGKISPRTNNILLAINIILFIGAIVLTILNLRVREWVMSGGMAFAAIVSGLNIYGCILRKHRKTS